MVTNRLSSWPCYDQEEADAVQRVLLSNKVNYWTGEEGRTFEREFANFANSKYAIALANGTVALELAIKALDIGVGDEVVVTPRTFIATVSCIINSGATPIFADVDLNSQNIEANTIEKVITDRTKAVIVVHLAGMPAEMDPIMQLAKSHDFFVIEDCAQAHGARYKGRSVGSIGDIGAWSFCQDKIMTTGGEGGMVTTNSKKLWATMWSYKDHGKSWESVYEKKHPPGFRWLHDSFGTNFRMTEMQSAIGRIQLRRMQQWTRDRNRNAKMLSDVVSKYRFIRKINLPYYVTHAYYKYYFFIDRANVPKGWSRDRIIEIINNNGVPCMQGSCSEVYLEKAFNNQHLPATRLLNAKELGETSIMMMVHPTLTENEMDSLCARLVSALTTIQAEQTTNKTIAL